MPYITWLLPLCDSCQHHQFSFHPSAARSGSCPKSVANRTQVLLVKTSKVVHILISVLRQWGRKTSLRVTWNRPYPQIPKGHLRLQSRKNLCTHIFQPCHKKQKKHRFREVTYSRSCKVLGEQTQSKAQVFQVILGENVTIAQDLTWPLFHHIPWAIYKWRHVPADHMCFHKGRWW